MNAVSTAPEKPSAAPSSAPSSDRLVWADLARGVGIILVVLGHACGGLIDANIPQDMGVLRPLFMTIYSFHMPLFFFLAGLFIFNRLKSNRQKFLENTFTKIGRSYFTWAIIQITIIALMGDLLNHPIEGSYLQEVIAVIWRPVSQYWFLYVLFFMQIISFVLIPTLGRYSVLILFVLARIGAEIYGIPEPYRQWMPLGQIVVFGLSFAIGVAAGPSLSRFKLISEAKPIYILFAAALWVALGMGAYHFISLEEPINWLFKYEGAHLAFIANRIEFYPAAIAGTLMTIFLCSSGALPFKAFFAYLGKYSMAIFLLHVIFVAGSRIVIMKIVPDVNVNILMVILTLIGMAAPLVVLEIARRLKWEKALALV